ncbi:hypothetical protein ACFL27_09535 [candidate division CSSED10-310 bacterium]|uniref:DUF4382 domain-containing protein n=1 Tax=candidate division CSSED10-310 bacterium TaxID=2855610 RepID=A0ABV6YW54_UNCC1
MKKKYVLLCLLLFYFITGCENDPELVTFFFAQNAVPNRNAVSLQSGVESGNLFDVVVHLGAYEQIPQNKNPVAAGNLLAAPPYRPSLLVDVRRVSFTLEYWNAIFEFLLQYEPGDFFESKSKTGIVHYNIGQPTATEDGLTHLSVDISIDSAIDVGRLYSEKGDLITLKFRGKRAGTVPLNFADRHGEVYNSEGERLTGISWYPGIVENFYN